MSCQGRTGRVCIRYPSSPRRPLKNRWMTKIMVMMNMAIRMATYTSMAMPAVVSPTVLVLFRPERVKWFTRASSRAAGQMKPNCLNMERKSYFTSLPNIRTRLLPYCGPGRSPGTARPRSSPPAPGCCPPRRGAWRSRPWGIPPRPAPSQCRWWGGWRWAPCPPRCSWWEWCWGWSPGPPGPPRQ